MTGLMSTEDDNKNACPSKESVMLSSIRHFAGKRTIGIAHKT